MADRSFDLFSGLASLGSKNHNWYDGLSSEGQKSAAPFVMMRWMTGTSDLAQIIRLNTVVNMHVFGGTADKSALFKLIAAAATGNSKRFTWVKGPTTKSKKLSVEVIKQFYDCSTREAVMYAVLPEDLLEMAEELGWEKEEITKLKKESDDGGQGVPKTGSSKPKKRPARK